MTTPAYPRFRPELDILREHGYVFDDPSDVVTIFEKRIASWAGAPFAVATDCATHAIELALRFTGPWKSLRVPKHTYLSVPQTVRNLGAQVHWSDEPWRGTYRLSPSPVVDASLRLREGMYSAGEFQCLSFQIKKRLPIGRGGMILTDNEAAYNWLRRAVYDGRTPGIKWKDDTITHMGYHYYMTPEDAARGLLLMDHGLSTTEDLGGRDDYPDLTTFDFFQRINEWS